MRRTLLLVVPLILSLGGPASAAEPEPEPAGGTDFDQLWQEGGDEVDRMMLEFPELPLTLDLELGFRYIDVKGNTRAMEYGDAESFPLLEAEWTLYRIDHRLSGFVDFDNPSNYRADLHYRFKDLFSVRGLVHGLHKHPDAGPAVDHGSSSRYEIDDTTNHHAERDMTSAELAIVVYAPDYPAHLFVRGWVMSRRDTRHQEFLGGSGYFDDLTRVHVLEDVETLTTELSVGGNAHLGPIELEYRHKELWFLRETGIPSYDFRGDGDPAAGRFQRNVVPEMHGRSDSVQLHTSYTGRITAALDFDRTTRANETSGVEGTWLSGTANISLVASDRLMISGRYQIRDVGWTGPATVDLVDLDSATTTATYPSKLPAASLTHRVRVVARYRLMPELALRADWRHVDRDRDDASAEAFQLPRRTLSDTVRMVFDARLGGGFVVEPGYSFKTTDTPSYNWEPDAQHRGELAIRWTPSSLFSARVRYDYLQRERSDLRITSLGEHVQTGEAMLDSHSFFASATVHLADSLQLNVVYSYSQFDDRRTLLYQSFAWAAPGYYEDTGALYSERQHVGSAQLTHQIASFLRLKVAFEYANGLTSLQPNLVQASEPVSIGEFSRRRTEQTRLDLELRAAFPHGWSTTLGASRMTIDFDEDDYAPIADGEIWAGSISVGKRFD